MASLYTLHPRPLSVLYDDIERHASSQPEAFVGTPGSILERENATGFRFYAHQWYDAEGKKRERYVAGPVGDPTADARVDELRIRITDLRGLVPSIRMLGREGFHLIDARSFATIAALHNQKMFAAGGLLVGSHAYGVVLNRLGVKADPYATEDVDIARPEALAFDKAPELGFLEMLKGSGIDFVEVPHLDRKRPSTSFKLRGRSAFHVDLLAPSRDETYPVIAVPELRTHAVGLPYLGYLLDESQPGAVLAREGCCAVRVPLPERFAIHKLVVSQLRTGRATKSDKDRHQASILCAVLGDTQSGALEHARAALPKRASKYLKAALAVVRPVLEARAPRAWEELAG
jgi:hypothetical protein